MKHELMAWMLMYHCQAFGQAYRAACERALLNYLPELRCDERTRYVLKRLDDYPTEPHTAP